MIRCSTCDRNDESLINLSNDSVSFHKVESGLEIKFYHGVIVGEASNVSSRSMGFCFTEWDAKAKLVWIQQGGCLSADAFDSRRDYQTAKGVANTSGSHTTIFHL